MACPLHQPTLWLGIATARLSGFQNPARALGRRHVVQIVKKHWRRFLPGGSLLDHDQEARIRFRLAKLVRLRDFRVARSAAALLNLI